MLELRRISIEIKMAFWRDMHALLGDSASSTGQGKKRTIKEKSQK